MRRSHSGPPPCRTGKWGTRGPREGRMLQRGSREPQLVTTAKADNTIVMILVCLVMAYGFEIYYSFDRII
jgi:hypothetical protein